MSTLSCPRPLRPSATLPTLRDPPSTSIGAAYAAPRQIWSRYSQRVAPRIAEQYTEEEENILSAAPLRSEPLIPLVVLVAPQLRHAMPRRPGTRLYHHSHQLC